MPDNKETTNFEDLSLEEMASQIQNPSPPAPEEKSEAQAPAAETKEVSAAEQPVVTEEPSAEASDEIPEKFKGKSAADIAKAYRELESTLGKMSSKRSHSEAEAEELRNRLALLESRVVQNQAPAAQQPQQEVDPLENLDEEFALEPTKAFKKVVNLLRGEISQSRELTTAERQAEKTQAHYEKLRTDPEFVALEPQMQQLAKNLAPVIDRRFINTPQFIDHLYTLAKGQNIEKYTSAAVTKAKTAGDKIKEEKRSATSESVQHSSAQETETAFEDLSLDQMKSRLSQG